jgi:hypothetical protein
LLVRPEWIDIHFKHFHSTSNLILEGIINTIYNVVSHHIDFRNIFIFSKLFDIFIQNINNNIEKIKFTKIAISLLLTCFKSKIEYKNFNVFEPINKSFPIFLNLIFISDDEIFIDCLWALYYISDYEKIEGVSRSLLDSGVIKRILSYDYNKSKTELIPTIRILGNLLYENDKTIIEELLNLEIIDFFNAILSVEKSKSIKRDVLWALSNLAGGTYEQMHQILESDILHYIIKQTSDYDYNVRKEAMQILVNICSLSSFGSSIELIKKGLYNEFLYLIETTTDINIIEMVLYCLECILKSGIVMIKITNENPMCFKFEQLGGISKLEKLLAHPNDTIYQKTEFILENYFKTIA